MRGKFTFRELLVVLAILAMLAALILPALQKLRDTAGRSSTTNNLKQIGLGILTHNDDFSAIPNNGGHTDPKKLPAINWSWHNPHFRNSGTWLTQIHPYMEADPFFRANVIVATDASATPSWLRNPLNNQHWHVSIRNYLCFGRARPGFKTGGRFPGVVTDFAINLFLNDPHGAANYHNGFATRGGLAVREQTKPKLQDLPDGAANTILVGGKALPPILYDDDTGELWDFGIFSPGHYIATGDRTLVHGTGTGRGHTLSPTPPKTPAIARAVGVPWMWRDGELRGTREIRSRLGQPLQRRHALPLRRRRRAQPELQLARHHYLREAALPQRRAHGGVRLKP